MVESRVHHHGTRCFQEFLAINLSQAKHGLMRLFQRYFGDTVTPKLEFGHVRKRSAAAHFLRETDECIDIELHVAHA